jgi:DNA-binding NtrC family response regulator
VEERWQSAKGLMSRVVLCACGASSRDALRGALEPSEFDLVCCAQGDALLEEALARRPDTVVYELRSDAPADLALLRLLRRVMPDVPLVLMAGDESLATQKLVRELRPIYYAVEPLDAGEILSAVRSALARHVRPVA